MISPHPAFARAKLEPVHEPLFSAIVTNVNVLFPAEVTWFQYGLGGVVSGAGTGAVAARLIHTNLETPAQLAMPKLHLVTGLRVVFNTGVDAVLTNLMTASAVSGAAGAATVIDSAFEDLLRVVYGTVFVFHVGTKDYFVGPTWMVPGNVGIGGVTSSSISDIGAAADEAVNLGAFHSAGKYQALPRFPILIPSQQNFFAALRAPQLTRPTTGIAADATTEHLIWCFLDGISGREVQ